MRDDRAGARPQVTRDPVDMTMRPATPEDFPAILALNLESEHFLSPLTPERLAQLHRQADLHQVIEDGRQVVAFVLALREGQDYDSPNYLFFGTRYVRFLYVDRVVVAAAAQGRGLGRALYEAVFAHASRSQLAWVTCEYDIEPPNPASERFHRTFGFMEVGRQSVAGGKKQVSLQAAPVRPGG
jgi:predicted GNAT superfamily acetyltransferase